MLIRISAQTDLAFGRNRPFKNAYLCLFTIRERMRKNETKPAFASH